MLSWLQLSCGEMCCKAWTSDLNEVSTEATEDGSIGVAGMRLWKLATAFGDDKWLGLVLCIGALSCCLGVIWSGYTSCKLITVSAADWVTTFMVGLDTASAVGWATAIVVRLVATFAVELAAASAVELVDACAVASAAASAVAWANMTAVMTLLLE